MIDPLVTINGHTQFLSKDIGNEAVKTVLKFNNFGYNSKGVIVPLVNIIDLYLFITVFIAIDESKHAN